MLKNKVEMFPLPHPLHIWDPNKKYEITTPS